MIIFFSWRQMTPFLFFGAKWSFFCFLAPNDPFLFFGAKWSFFYFLTPNDHFYISLREAVIFVFQRSDCFCFVLQNNHFCFLLQSSHFYVFLRKMKILSLSKQPMNLSCSCNSGCWLYWWFHLGTSEVSKLSFGYLPYTKNLDNKKSSSSATVN